MCEEALNVPVFINQALTDRSHQTHIQAHSSDIDPSRLELLRVEPGTLCVGRALWRLVHVYVSWMVYWQPCVVYLPP